MQAKDGGWAAFDVDNNWEFLSAVPFADHNAMLDPTCPDITGRVLEALIAHGVQAESSGDSARRRVPASARRKPTEAGTGAGASITSTARSSRCAACRRRAKSDREAHILRAGEWLRSIQNADGGWGESCASYDQNTFVAAPSSPSQTAWAVLGLLAGGDTTSQSLHNGIEYLIDTQRADGSWDENLSTGTGFPGVFYLKYHLYRNSFPVLAMSSYLKSRGPNGADRT